MINYLGKFCPNLSDSTNILRELEKKDKNWIWQDEHEQKFQDLKRKISTAPILRYYDVNLPVTI